MKPCDYNLILRAIENCEEREKLTCEGYITLFPENRERIENNRDMFLFATFMVREELDRLLKGAAHV